MNRPPWPRRNWRAIWTANPQLRRRMHCDGVVAIMAREGVDVDLKTVERYYDEVIVPARGKA